MFYYNQIIESMTYIFGYSDYNFEFKVDTYMKSYKIELHKTIIVNIGNNSFLQIW